MQRQTTAEPMDAIALLKADHRTVEDLFEKFEKSNSKAAKRKLAEQVCTELMIHAMIEEEIFYPYFSETVEEDLLHEAYVEHDSAKMLIAEIMAGSPGDEFFDAKVKVLSEEIKHHVKEEERRVDGFFAQARKTDADFMELGRRLMERKEELKKQFARRGLPAPETRTLQGAPLVYGQPVESGAAA